MNRVNPSWSVHAFHQNEVVVIVRLGLSSPAVDEAKHLADEKETYLGFFWWSVSEIEASAVRFYPGSLPMFLRRAMQGEQIDEPFEYFS